MQAIRDEVIASVRRYFSPLTFLWRLCAGHPPRGMTQRKAVRVVTPCTARYFRCDQGLRLLGSSNGISER